jgi:hypothetical protein
MNIKEPLFLLAILTGCAPTYTYADVARGRAKADFDFPTDQLTATPAEPSGSYQVAGCGKDARYVCSDQTTHHAPSNGGYGGDEHHVDCVRQ